MKKSIKTITFVLFAMSLLLSLASCTEAQKFNHNLSMEANYFSCERKITVYNAIKGEVIFEIEGYMNISNNEEDELVVTCKVGEEEYKKNYIYLNRFTLYVVEDITGTHTDPYHYKVYFNKNIFPDVEIKP